MARPFKVFIPEKKEQFGVVARSLRLLRDGIQKRYGLKSGFKIFLTDGTVVDDEEYFAFLEPQTLLIVKNAIPLDDAKTSVVDLTSPKEAQALVCNERDVLYEQVKVKEKLERMKDSQPLVENKSTGVQTSAVLSIQIAKVQGDVEWEGAGMLIQPNAAPSTTYPCTTDQLQQQTSTTTNSIPLHHPHLIGYPNPQTVTTCSASSSRGSVMTVIQHQRQRQEQQLQSAETAFLRELYQQGQLQKHYQQQQQVSSQTQVSNAVLRPSQRYYIHQQQQQQVGRNRNYHHVLYQLSSRGYNSNDLVQQQHYQQHQQQYSCLPPH